MRIGSRPHCQAMRFLVSQYGETPHEVAEFKVSLELSSQLLVKVPSALARLRILIEKNRVKGRQAFGEEVGACVVDGWCIHEVKLVAWRQSNNWQKASTALSAATKSSRRFSYPSRWLGRVRSEAVQRAA